MKKLLLQCKIFVMKTKLFVVTINSNKTFELDLFFNYY